MSADDQSDNSTEKHEGELEDKRKDYISKINYCMVSFIANEWEITELKKERIKIENNN